MLDGFSFFKKLVSGDSHFSSLLCVDFQIIDNTPFFILNGNWNTIEQIFRNFIFVTIRPNSERNPIVSMSLEPTSHMLESGISSASGTGKASILNNLSSSLLNSRDERLSVPLFSN